MSLKEYPQHLSRLKEEQEKALAETLERINQMHTFRSDYKALKARLTTLPDQLTHDVMVPFGKMAFMPGQLVHTNEILVLLGDDWFVDRSAKQAAEIVDRRITNIDKQIEDLNQQMRLLEPRHDFTSELHSMARSADGVMQDIREEYDEEKEKLWKESHKKNVQAHKQRQRREVEEVRESQTPLTDDQMWARLDQLEREESERREMEKIRAEANEPVYEPRGEPVSSQPWSEPGTCPDTSESDETSDDYVLDSDDDVEEEEETDGEECQEVTVKGKVIHFVHSGKVEDPPAKSTIAEDTITGGIIQSPGDIFTAFKQPTKPASILKKSSVQVKKSVNRKKSRKPVVTFDTGSSDDNVTANDHHTLPRGPAAFSGTVLEKPIVPNMLGTSTNEKPSNKPVSQFRLKSTNEQAVNNSVPSLPSSTSDKSDQSSRPVSRFKAQRQKTS